MSEGWVQSKRLRPETPKEGDGTSSPGESELAGRPQNRPIWLTSEIYDEEEGTSALEEGEHAWRPQSYAERYATLAERVRNAPARARLARERGLETPLELYMPPQGPGTMSSALAVGHFFSHSVESVGGSEHLTGWPEPGPIQRPSGPGWGGLRGQPGPRPEDGDGMGDRGRPHGPQGRNRWARRLRLPRSQPPDERDVYKPHQVHWDFLERQWRELGPMPSQQRVRLGIRAVPELASDRIQATLNWDGRAAARRRAGRSGRCPDCAVQ